jgi:acyl-coenzyme A synthetase/AMP-(fatty) acid ligase
MNEAAPRYTGEMPPARFNLARYCLGEPSSKTPDKIALIVASDAQAPLDAAERWTYGALDEAVRRVGAGLLDLGLAPGDRLMIRMPNTGDYALFFFGAIAAGIVPLPVSTQLTESEADFIAVDSGAAAVVIAGNVAMGKTGAVRRLDANAIATVKRAPPLPDYADTAAADPAFLIYTSGTSSRPKGVLHAQRSAWGRRPMYQGWYGITGDDVMLHAGAFNWSYTLGVGLTDPWANGASTVLYNGPKDIQVWPRLIVATGATLFAAVPSLYRQILKYCDLGSPPIGRLRRCLAAGEALSPTLLAEWQSVTGLELSEAFGMSECSTFVSNRPGMAVKPGSPGKPQEGRAIAILPVDGGADPLPVGKVGLLAIHRDDPGLMLGYWQRPDENALVFRGGWFVSGDLAACDGDGYVWFHGRADDVMNAGGYRVSPVEVEAALADHPAIAEVAVAEHSVRPDVSIIAAYVVVRPGETPGADLARAIIDHTEARLAAYKRPREVFFVDRLPRTANGKILRRSLGATLTGAAT